MHLLTARAALQVIQVPDVALAAASASPSGAVFFAGAEADAPVSCLAPVPLHQQAAAAAALGQFQQALALANMMPPGEVRSKKLLPTRAD